VESIAFPKSKRSLESYPVFLCVPCGKDLASLNRNDAGAFARFDFRHSRNHSPREFEDRLGMRRIFALQHDRLSAVAGLADFGIEFDVPEKRNAVLLRHIFGAAAGENIDLMIAVRTGEKAHVLDHADDIDFHLLEHLDGLARILQRNVGGR